jgi:small-conductance mechanosensitive channel
MTLSIAILTASMNIGGFLSPFFFDAYQSIFQLKTVASTCLYIGITLAVGATISIILAIRSRSGVMENNLLKETQVRSGRID